MSEVAGFDPNDQSDWASDQEYLDASQGVDEIPGLSYDMETVPQDLGEYAVGAVDPDSMSASEMLSDEESAPIVTLEGWRSEYQRIYNKMNLIAEGSVMDGNDPLQDEDYKFLLGELNGARKQVVRFMTAEALKQIEQI